jgi:hypothetical protein
MSVEAITWALGQPIERSTAKFVLVAMANCANNEMECWPSIAYLAGATAQDRKTVQENMRRLAEAGYIEPTGEHRGTTNQIVVYRLVKDAQKRNTSENGTVPKTDRKRPVFPTKEARFSAETGPKTDYGTVKEPSRNQKKSAPPCVAPAVLVEAGFDEGTAAEFIAHKTAMKAPLTARAWADHLTEAAKAGWTPKAAAEKVMAKSWKGFEAKYVASEAKPPPVDHFAGAL